MKAADVAKLAQAADMAALAQKISHDVKEYLVVAEQEQTKRAAIKYPFRGRDGSHRTSALLNP